MNRAKVAASNDGIIGTVKRVTTRKLAISLTIKVRFRYERWRSASIHLYHLIEKIGYPVSSPTGRAGEASPSQEGRWQQRCIAENRQSLMTMERCRRGIGVLR